MQYKELGFRPFYHHFCLIPMRPVYLEGMPGFPDVETCSYLLSFGFIDHNAGFTFEVLGAASKNEDGSYHFSDTNPKKRFYLRAQRIFEDDIILLEENYWDRFTEKLELLKRQYQVNEKVVQTRSDTSLDRFRDFFLMDDVFVYLALEKKMVECVWVRIEGKDEVGFYGSLLTEPEQDLGLHLSHLVRFESQQLEDGSVIFRYTGKK